MRWCAPLVYMSLRTQLLYYSSSFNISMRQYEKSELWTGMHNLHVGLSEHFRILYPKPLT